MKVHLLDVNVLLALAWPNHQHHGAAHRWFEREGHGRWATCAVTQLGFVRLSSNPAFTAEAVAPREAAVLLQRLCEHPGHRFLSSPPACTPEAYKHALGHRQVMDAWLVEVARSHRGRLATLDRGVTAHGAGDEVVLLLG